MLKKKSIKDKIRNVPEKAILNTVVDGMCTEE